VPELACSLWATFAVRSQHVLPMVLAVRPDGTGRVVADERRERTDQDAG